MTDIITLNTWMQADCTLGRLAYKDFHCFSLELPWLRNNKNISCIPAGQYRAQKYASPKHGNVLLLQNVPGRDYIEVHAGNYTKQILGCILVGKAITYLDRDTIPDVTQSKNTLNTLLSLIPEFCQININRI